MFGHLSSNSVHTSIYCVLYLSLLYGLNEILGSVYIAHQTTALLLNNLLLSSSGLTYMYTTRYRSYMTKNRRTKQCVDSMYNLCIQLVYSYMLVNIFVKSNIPTKFKLPESNSANHRVSYTPKQIFRQPKDAARLCRNYRVARHIRT